MKKIKLSIFILLFAAGLIAGKVAQDIRATAEENLRLETAFSAEFNKQHLAQKKAVEDFELQRNQAK